MPVHELLGGPTRSEQRVYWSHLATYQVAFSEILGTPAVESWDDIRALVRQALDAGYTGFKTNFVTPGGGGRRPLFLTSTDKVASRDFLADAVTQIETMRDEAGPDIDIMVDINQNFRPEGQIKIAQALEPYDITWLEIDNLSADALKKVRSSTRTTILTGERLLTTHEYYPYFEAGAMDVIKLDLQWQGLISARQVANMAYHYEMNVAPHNFNGHLSTFQTMNLCATVNNVKISESDPVQTPWRDELFTNVPEISGGMVKIPDGPGWGTDLNEDAAAKYLVDG